ncbi:putative F-box/FBD/LRR-repeat protein At1g16940 [Eutrema salsugineum]|uniref:putative F-box/FBD/LRR-repeat protein At1g16940 n=1 Tax=Eutrema salsugineum TaxID=72664 RepID=UPI000CED5B23|nr:putative F-box/FBD/LRR-repeat protein At1g16940 [Eutrema salsugineum]
MTKKAVGDADIINQLPDSLLYEILLKLPTKDVVKTSLLCRRWRNVWKSVPGLDLDFNSSVDFAKYEFFDRFMDLNSDLCLQRVKLSYVEYRLNKYNEATINTVIDQQKNIQHLDVASKFDRVTIPPTIYTSCESLVSLKLYCASLPKPPHKSSVSLPCLKILDLQQIVFLADDNLCMEMLISACPALQTLTMDKMYAVKVSSPSLLSFCLNKNEYGYHHQATQVVLDTPRLKYLKLKHHFVERIIVNDLSSIVKLDLDDLINFGESFPGFLTLISRVRYFNLTISSDFLRVNRKLLPKSESVIHNLSTLSVKDIPPLGYWEYLLLFLERCPNLKSLVMGFQGYHYGINFYDVPHCVLSSLEFVEVRARHIADMEKLVSYFMANSTVLKKFTLCLYHMKNEDVKILDRLFTLPRRSRMCELCCSL